MNEHILLIDDEDLVLKMQSTYLSDHGYLCQSAKNADEASRLLSQQTFDLVLLDIKIPGRSGVELLREIKEHRPDTAVIMVTAVDDLETALQCSAMGADDYIVKPFSPGRVIISVRNTLEKRRLYRNNLTCQNDLKKELERQSEKIKASQAIAMQQEKLAAIGQLAAGVAHEINNPIGFITSNLNTLQRYLERYDSFIDSVMGLEGTLSETNRENLKNQHKKLKIDLLREDSPGLIEDCLEGADRIKTIVQGLKGFTRTDTATPSLTDINQCLESAISITWNEIKYKATIERDLGELPQILCYPQQLSQVFMNLLVNAAHAISEKGMISISTRHTDNQIKIIVADTGCGIPPENQSKIFEPFFTTKEHGKGTGLGMSIAYDIIVQHHGSIWFASEVGKGTTFIVQLPIETV